MSQPVLAELEELDTVDDVALSSDGASVFVIRGRAFSRYDVASGDIEVLDRPAQPSFWSPEGWWRDSFSRRLVVTEYGKLVYYVLRGWA